MSDIVKGHVAAGYERVREIYQQASVLGFNVMPLKIAPDTHFLCILWINLLKFARFLTTPP